MIPFAAVLLAGGQSRRMGRDKALLPLPDGRLLWQRQLAVLRELDPAELFISGPPRPDFPGEIPLLTDAAPGLGPLAGIAEALTVMRSPLLVVLAVDLPRMTTGFLRELIRAGNDGCGVVPQRDRSAGGFYEPLGAVYPREALPYARHRLAGDDLSLQGFVRELVAAALVQPWPLDAATALGCFANWNTPETGISPGPTD